MFEKFVNANLFADGFLQVGAVLDVDLLHGAGLAGVSIDEKLDFGERALAQDLHQVPAFDKFSNHFADVCRSVERKRIPDLFLVFRFLLRIVSFAFAPSEKQTNFFFFSGCNNSCSSNISSFEKNRGTPLSN